MQEAAAGASLGWGWEGGVPAAGAEPPAQSKVSQGGGLGVCFS